MTRKDYVAIAFSINVASRIPHYRDQSPGAVTEAIACGIAEYMGKDNPRFDRARFLKACGVQS